MGRRHLRFLRRTALARLKQQVHPIRRITPDDLAELDPVVPETRRLLSNS